MAGNINIRKYSHPGPWKMAGIRLKVKVCIPRESQGAAGNSSRAKAWEQSMDKIYDFKGRIFFWFCHHLKLLLLGKRVWIWFSCWDFLKSVESIQFLHKILGSKMAIFVPLCAYFNVQGYGTGFQIPKFQKICYDLLSSTTSLIPCTELEDFGFWEGIAPSALTPN